MIRFFLSLTGLLLLFSLHAPARAQDGTAGASKYWIFLRDKPEVTESPDPKAEFVSRRALRRRQLRGTPPPPHLDVPPSPRYLAALRGAGVEPIVRSRWLNAVSARLDEQQLDVVRALPFVRDVRPVAATKAARHPTVAVMPMPMIPDAATHCGPSCTQLELMNDSVVLERGIDGTGVRLGFLDTQFGDFAHPAFDHLREEARVIAVQDFTGQPQSNLHGLAVASVAVGYDEGRLIGPAHGAEVLAATTEYAPSETNQEEDYFVAGLEWLEANGVDVVNVSLGYTRFDEGERSYDVTDLDGDTGVTTRAVDRAASLGVVVVTSAGNDGCDSPDRCWYFVSTPADADSVITVGAVMPDSTKAPFSSMGPTADGRIKPDVAAMGARVVVAVEGGYAVSNGTSFSSPLVAGVVCQMLQVNPTLSPMEIRNILRQTASQATSPDHRLGWGIVDAHAAILEAERRLDPVPQVVSAVAPYPNPFHTFTVFEINAPEDAGTATLSIYDMMGRQVAVPFAGPLQPGLNRIVFHPLDLPAGVYAYALRGDNMSETGTVTYIR